MKRTLIIPESLDAAAMETLEAADPRRGNRLGAPRADEFLEGARWVLERDAEKGRRVWQDPPIYVLSMEGGAKHPPLSLFYTIAYDKVLLLSLSWGNEANAGTGAMPARGIKSANRPPRPSGIGPGSDGY